MAHALSAESLTPEFIMTRIAALMRYDPTIARARLLQLLQHMAEEPALKVGPEIVQSIVDARERLRL